ncbi:hypothetical protein CC79DRAFT_1327775 [Sarocladium strictum]
MDPESRSAPFEDLDRPSHGVAFPAMASQDLEFSKIGFGLPNHPGPILQFYGLVSIALVARNSSWTFLIFHRLT